MNKGVSQSEQPQTPPGDIKPIDLSMGRLVMAVAAALLIAGGAMAGVLTVLDDPAAWRGFAAGTIASVVAGLASILPLWIGSQFGMMGLVGGFFAASFVRAGIALGGCLAAVWLWDFPPVSTLISMGVYYMAVLTAESIVVSMTLWHRPVE